MIPNPAGRLADKKMERTCFLEKLKKGMRHGKQKKRAKKLALFSFQVDR